MSFFDLFYSHEAPGFLTRLWTMGVMFCHRQFVTVSATASTGHKECLSVDARPRFFDSYHLRFALEEQVRPTAARAKR